MAVKGALDPTPTKRASIYFMGLNRILSMIRFQTEFKRYSNQCPDFTSYLGLVYYVFTGPTDQLSLASRVRTVDNNALVIVVSETGRGR